MRFPILILLLIGLSPTQVSAQEFSMLTWNIQDMGRTKNDQEISFMAQVMKDYDLICIQEVVAGDPAGAQSVGRLGELLKTMGSNWEYRISDPTGDVSAYKKERYAFLWKPSKLTLVGRPFLDKELDEICTREPYIGQFALQDGCTFYVVNFHSRRFDDNPHAEIATFQYYPKRLNSDRILIAGDFNTTETDAVFQLLYDVGFNPTVRNTPSTLKRKCTSAGKYVNHAIDNIYFSERMNKNDGVVVDLVGDCGRLAAVRKVSDHLPVVGVLEVKCN